MKIGIISDTHFDRFIPIKTWEWLQKAFSGVDLIIHAGDIECDEVLEEMSSIAPVQAVRGNADRLEQYLPLTRLIELDGGLVVVAHRFSDACNAVQKGTILLVHGHTHAGEIFEENGITVINPGSASKPRDGRPPSVVVADITAGIIKAEFNFKPHLADE